MKTVPFRRCQMALNNTLRRIKPFRYTLLLIVLMPFALSAQQRVKVMHYNLLQFGNSCPPVNVNQKVGWLNAILNYYQPDILTVNELAPQRAYAQNIRLNAFTYTENIEFGEITNQANSQIVNAIFYNALLWGYDGVEVINGGFRDINVYKLFTQASVASGSDTTFLYCIVTHFKAGSSTNDINIRNKDAGLIADWVEAHPDRENILLMGDFNFGSANEDGFELLTENPNIQLRFEDPARKSNGWGGQSHASIHTQSTRNTRPDCGSDGGLDDRFDMILTRPAIIEGKQGVSYVPGTYAALGNDGTSFNSELNCNGDAVPILICASLKQMSDHLPVVMELDLEAGIATTGLDDLKQAGIYLNNPFDDEILLSWDSSQLNETSFQLTIRDLMGRIVYKQDIPTRQAMLRIPASSFSPGVYVLNVWDQEKGKIWGGKVVKRD